MEQKTLHKKWIDLALTYSDIPAVADETFKELVSCYTSGGRSYHTLEHITQLLMTAVTFKEHLKDYSSIRFAIWFHDVIYNQIKNNNEELSADFAEKHLGRLLVPDETIHKVINLIKATAHHMDATPIDLDMDYFLDFDLMILGGSEEAYTIYSNQIREEYKLIPDLIYKPGRKKILKRFLGNSRIYRTPDFFKLYEKQARLNLKLEIETL